MSTEQERRAADELQTSKARRLTRQERADLLAGYMQALQFQVLDVSALPHINNRQPLRVKVDKLVVAASEHECRNCLEVIKPREPARCVTLRYDDKPKPTGNFLTWYYCSACMEAMIADMVDFNNRAYLARRKRNDGWREELK